MQKINSLLWELGIRGTYKGHLQMAVAVRIATKNSEALLAVTKLLYPEIAKECGTTPTSVERNLRTVVSICWEHGNRALLQKIAGYPLVEKPTTKDFIDILVTYLKLCKEEIRPI